MGECSSPYKCGEIMVTKKKSENQDEVIKMLKSSEYEFAYYVSKMVRLEVYHWLNDSIKKGSLDQAVNLIFNSSYDAVFPPNQHLDVEPPTETLYKDVLEEIRDGSDAVISCLEECEIDGFEEVDEFDNLTNHQKVQLWMDLISNMADHEPFPVLENFI